MKLPSLVLGVFVCVTTIGAAFAHGQSTPVVTLTRLQCGTNAAPTDVGQRFSDTYAITGLKVQLTFSCYLIKHGTVIIQHDDRDVGKLPAFPAAAK
jgi:N-acyl homoserine lactone hydrolase